MFHAQNLYSIIISDHFRPVLWFLVVFTVLFLVSTKPYRNDSVLVRSTARSSAAIGVNTESFRNWLEVAQHSSTSWNEIDVTSPDR